MCYLASKSRARLEKLVLVLVFSSLKWESFLSVHFNTAKKAEQRWGVRRADINGKLILLYNSDVSISSGSDPVD